jgi:hypothetical protein
MSLEGALGRRQQRALKEDHSMRPKGLRFGMAAAGTAVLALAVAAGAWAQGAFYREVAKDGRRYVFNLDHIG